ncbi:hypothetical protein [Lactiplantibacillus plantarum]|uniref:hypothetical protein n=1 Tax=Lactiplantibacillus plantarum TaxID=1590 RepID=UPI001BA53486|nr:hypothetical protein [Lactiplantibacillus plantarum]MBS0936334.1 hypothetical protein [Lactiplantibacillus plantarum]MBS0943763.1 hypothetical protein [Lactiplantibacillus plantarum]
MKIKTREEAESILLKVSEYEVKNYKLTDRENENEDYHWEPDGVSTVASALEGVEFYVALEGNEENGWEIALFDGQDNAEPYEILGSTFLEALESLKNDWDGDEVYFWAEPEFGSWAHELVMPNTEVK